MQTIFNFYLLFDHKLIAESKRFKKCFQDREQSLSLSNSLFLITLLEVMLVIDQKLNICAKNMLKIQNMCFE